MVYSNLGFIFRAELFLSELLTSQYGATEGECTGNVAIIPSLHRRTLSVHNYSRYGGLKLNQEVVL